ncbi:MAG: putative nucleotide-diphospho-sugar transferase [Terrimicrobiaceae bacterium]
MNYSLYIKDGLLCWTLTSNGYKYLTLNFYKHWQRSCSSTPLLIVCADKPSYTFFVREGISCRLVDEGVQDYGIHISLFGTRNFQTLNRMKLRILHMIANDPAVMKSIYLDGDICIYRNFLDDIQGRLEVCPLVFQCDENEKEKECSKPCKNVCTGLIAFVHGHDNGIFKIDDLAVWKQKPEDQVWVNHKIEQVACAYDTLPRELYPNGARLNYTQTNPGVLEKAFLCHYNYRVGNSKKMDMKRYGDWMIPY